MMFLQSKSAVPETREELEVDLPVTVVTIVPGGAVAISTVVTVAYAIDRDVSVVP
jgi:hypothetical protein